MSKERARMDDGHLRLGAMPARAPVPRGRHAPPLEVRLELQRGRLLKAAAEVFAGRGYAEASAEAIARQAGMSKATFYEHFANKEEAILALFDEAAGEVLSRLAAAVAEAPDEPEARMRAGLWAFVDALADHPEASQTLLVEIIGVGPGAAERRDAILEGFATYIDAENARAHERFGVARLRSPHDAFALVGAISELASRQLRLGRPADVRELGPVLERLVTGLLLASA
jgi:AcrR family transcriptional regulator